MDAYMAPDDVGKGLQSHADERTSNLNAAGRPPDRKRRPVFSGWSIPVVQEFRHACRSLTKHPGFALVAVLTLALGIGASAAIVSLGDALLRRPLPYPDADRLVALRSSR